MKKVQIAKIIIVAITFLLTSIFLLGSTSYAAELNPDDLASQSKFNLMGGKSEGIDETFVKGYAEKILSVGIGLAVVVAVIAVMYLGLKYITAGVTEKADYKKDIIPVLIGIGIIVFLTTIISTIARFAESI